MTTATTSRGTHAAASDASQPDLIEARQAVADEFRVDPGQLEVAYEAVDPATARVWLDTNQGNRSISVNRVATYARDMSNGTWRITGEAIQFDTDGNLIDGQHRLWAVADADTTVTFLVVRGLPRGTRDYIDTGARRTMGNVLQMAGEPDPNVLAAAAVLLWQWDKADRFTNLGLAGARTVSHGELLTVIRENPDLRSAVEFARHRSIAGISVSVRAFVLYKLRLVAGSEADEFIADLSTMRTEGVGDPKSALLRRLASASVNNQKLDRYSQARLLFRTWNAYRRGEELQRLQVWTRGTDVGAEEPI